jgi:hypothetical protein
MHRLRKELSFTIFHRRQKIASRLQRMLEMDVECQDMLVLRGDCISEDGCNWLWLVLVALELFLVSGVQCEFPYDGKWKSLDRIVSASSSRLSRLGTPTT